MARAAATDPLHSFRFHVRADSPVPGIGDPLQPDAGFDGGGIIGNQPEAGFQAVTTPEYTLEMAEYREGTKTYTEKYPGVPTVNDLTLSRGVARADSKFVSWILAAIEGSEYRADLTIFHATREGRGFPFDADADFTEGNSKRYSIKEALPARVKPAADMDATTSDVSLAEIDVSFERFTVANPSTVPSG